MWQASDQEALGLDGRFLPPQQQQVPRNNHDVLFHRQHQTSQPQLSEQHSVEFAQAQTPGQVNNSVAHVLPQGLLTEAAQGHTADLPNMQLDLDSVTLSAALGLGGDSVLAQFQRSLSDQNVQSSSEFSAILAASLGVLPVSASRPACYTQNVVFRTWPDSHHIGRHTGSHIYWQFARTRRPY